MLVAVIIFLILALLLGLWFPVSIFINHCPASISRLFKLEYRVHECTDSPGNTSFTPQRKPTWWPIWHSWMDDYGPYTYHTLELANDRIADEIKDRGHVASCKAHPYVNS